VKQVTTSGRGVGINGGTTGATTSKLLLFFLIEFHEKS